MSKTATTAPADKLALYDKLVTTHPDVERKGATMPYTSVNGHMFSFLTGTGTMALRLPAEQRDAFLTRYQSRLCEQHGTVMKEYVEIPDSLLENTRALQKLFALSYEYVKSLKPKPTKRKKATAKPTPKTTTPRKIAGGGAKKRAAKKR